MTPDSFQDPQFAVARHTAVETNVYDCWIAGQRCDTEEQIVASTSFEARKAIAHKYRLAVSDAVAQRVR